ncbi:hypothetical protein C1645_775221 [Glomus cerebriforme]|uniref:Uncharacterized protein n=1 Tax=Glomus cerebriforme TaxID=658196 RepID=A0A397SQ51_9GLOM|nr:hypothetical protein C1645_775221 [Glomus cerebriforme]
MLNIVDNNTEVLNAVRKYFDGDLEWSVPIDSLIVWLETQNISISGKDLSKLVQEHKDEFEIEVKKAPNNIIQIKLRKVIMSAFNGSSTGNGSYIKDMIELQQAEFLKNDTKSYLHNNINSELNTESLFYEEIIKDFSRDPPIKVPLHISSQPTVSQDKPPEQIWPKNVARESKALECAKKYLNLFLVDSIFDLEQHMKSKGVIKGSAEFQDFLHENREIFQIFPDRGITCIKLANSSIKITENSNTMIKRRFSQTERLIKDYIIRQGRNEGVSSTELSISLRGIEGCITDEIEEFLKNCKDSFECILKNENYYIKMIPQPSKPVISTLPNTNSNKNKSSILQLVREFLVKQTIASVTEIKEHLKEYQKLLTFSISEFVNSHFNEFKSKKIDGNLYLRLKPTDANIISYIRKYLLEFGKTRLSTVEDYLRRQDMCPRNKLEDFLHPFPDFKLTGKQPEIYIQSQNIDIARHLRQFLKGKGEVLISLVYEYLVKKNITLNCKLIEFLENYPEFILSQGPTDILVKYSPVPNEISPREFVHKYVTFEGGKVPLHVLVSHLNWNGSFPEFKLVELIYNSEEFSFQTFENETWVIVNHITNAYDATKLNLAINDNISSTGKIISPNFSEITVTKPNHITFPDVHILEEQEKKSLEKSMIDVTTKSNGSDTSPRTYISSTTSSEAGKSDSQFEPLIPTKIQFTKPPQFESIAPTSLQSDTLSSINAQPVKISKSETSSIINEQIPNHSLSEPLFSIQINRLNNQQKETRNTENDIQELILRDDYSIEDMLYQNNLFCHSLLETNRALFNNYTSLGILESLPNEIVYLNGKYPFSMIITGLPNSGVSQTKNTIIEGFLIKNTRLGKLNFPFSALILRYDNSVMALPCESALVATSAKHSGMFDQDTRAERVVVLVTSSNYQNMLRLYANIDNCEVIPLLFSENDLCSNDIESWINIEGEDAQMHEQAKELINNILYFHTHDQFNYTEFCTQLYNGCFNNPRMKTFLNTRLSKLDSFIVEKLKGNLQIKSFIDKFIPLKDLFQPGVAVIVDLSDPLLGAKMASELFNIILGIHTRCNLKSSLIDKTESYVRKLVVLDEAHKVKFIVQFVKIFNYFAFLLFHISKSKCIVLIIRIIINSVNFYFLLKNLESFNFF